MIHRIGRFRHTQENASRVPSLFQILAAVFIDGSNGGQFELLDEVPSSLSHESILRSMDCESSPFMSKLRDSTGVSMEATSTSFHGTLWSLR